MPLMQLALHKGLSQFMVWRMSNVRRIQALKAEVLSGRMQICELLLNKPNTSE
jgi:hypothetical protein